MTNETGFLETNGARLYYEVDGDGPPVLLIHGGLGSLRMWDEVVPALTDRYRVVRYDARGFGQTDTQDVEFSNRADAIALLDHLGVDAAVVVGQSRGGNIALDLSIERPQRVTALVSVAGGVGGHDAALPEGVEAPPWDEMERLAEARDWDSLSELETRVWVDGWGQPMTRVDQAIRSRVHDWILSTYQAEKPERRPIPLQPPAVERLDELRIPVLVMLGTADEPGGILSSRHLAGSVPGTRLVEFENVAHMIQLEQPDRFNRELATFLADVT
ncbi:MAG: alpha/beta fold hydrolase [Candidatus Limnocylindria bacterium]